MAPAHRTRSEHVDYTWISAGVDHIKHESRIARGGYGEVHKVQVSLGFAADVLEMRNEITGEVVVLLLLLTIRSLLEKFFAFSETLAKRISTTRLE